VKDRFSKSTDTEHEIKVDSSILETRWTAGHAFAGRELGYHVRTTFVGEGGPVKLEMKNDKGKTIAKESTEIFGNLLTGVMTVPADMKVGDGVVLHAKLPKHGLDMESARVPVRIPPEMTSMRWGQEEARRDDLVDLICELKHVVDGTPARLTIMEYDADGAHDRITDIETVVDGGKIETTWAFEYHEDTDELPTKEESEQYGGSYNPPEYFFVVVIEEVEFGKEQESGILKFKDWLEISAVDYQGRPLVGAKYELKLPDGTTQSGTLDDQGVARVEGIPPGRLCVEFPDQDEPPQLVGK